VTELHSSVRKEPFKKYNHIKHISKNKDKDTKCLKNNSKNCNCRELSDKQPRFVLSCTAFSIYSDNTQLRSKRARIAGTRRTRTAARLVPATPAPILSRRHLGTRVSLRILFSSDVSSRPFADLADRILEQMHNQPSSPQPVPNAAKSPTSQEYSHSLGSTFSNRWKRSSPDPNKMMMGRSPNVLDVNAKRVLSTTPSRKSNHLTERVGSPSLSGYPVRFVAFFIVIFMD
jgi:hypothetical protein